ncbi:MULTISPECIES: monofunctional biosynthetic peptidoglycan transglycosylase [unclassified Ruegeria]|uniref:monofunctional biosynthetic peptidoglycan transglycosylase n=1 Tax=unclassified Ruegeria TaxID=2625375 RepID=UPI001487DD16|nr:MULTISPECIES: monofunctional biosynthetic peptidoglycan transglycosylase [unclassified Ruegeria]NOD76012.1 monofunctional biosynthetic peptidoglycan transglycosylase [Ruegeria sp. HKCCD4332]NOD89971.1 monofunctional biosynthetic peptidoglycan transglycosylase [Ruegeria sp. HKCCD4318]NOD93887.1 monofunctional biosynthetic peptidoglycan transglycosylase [Ruegeria sp. HKCCD4884]NOE15044.1 monofunctional biosynthetic peptidoglycan transglycosylase [Ruegeria sp. HKCCD4318-2]NOG10745.1 monofuncti
MAKKAARKSGGKKSKATKRKSTVAQTVRRWATRAALAIAGLVVALVLFYSVVNPPVTHTIWSEWRRLGKVEREWVPIEEISPIMARSVVAAEDANFCQHWGFDVEAIRDALEGGGNRGASTITQQVVKNVFLWQGRSWVRKAMETSITPVVEIFWSKQRILEVYLNVAETGNGVFGVEAAAQRYFNRSAAQLTSVQAARIAAILPSPRNRSVTDPSVRTRRRAASILDGAATIRADGRADCFED